jgi:hypothetical protein
MLNSDYIHLKIKTPQTCYSIDSGNFKELIELYPYASTFSVLYLKSLANSGDIRLENELEKYAFRINDRSVLYKLIHLQQSHEISIEKPSDEIAVDEESVDSKIELNNPFDQVNFIEETEQNILEIEDSEIGLRKSLDASVQLEDELDKLITSSAIASTFVEKELESLPKIKQEDEIIPEVEKNENVQENSPIEGKSIIKSSSKSFGDWLKASSNENNEAIEEVDEGKRAPEYYTFEKPKKEFFSPSKKAKESLDENKMPVSETLAKILALQGNFSKAIYVYEQLILIFPEKKTFFASQIKNLKKKINL